MVETAKLPATPGAEGTIQVVPLPAPSETIDRMRADLRQWEAYWQVQQKAAAGTEGAASPAAIEAAAVRTMLRSIIGPRLDQLATSKSPHLSMLLNLMVPFDTVGGLEEFMLHFFQVAEETGGHPYFAARDPYERDLYVLYDLYRVKKTMEVINILQQARADPERTFPSIFSGEEIDNILASLKRVLALLPVQCLPEKHRKEIFPQLSPQFLHAQKLLDRREGGILYTYPHVLEKYDYRRFFFLVFFKTGLRARVAEGEKEFRYDFVHFQVLKHEYMVHWLTGPLLGDPRKFEIYKKYTMHGKTLLELIDETPHRERELLQQMPAHALNDMASRVNEAVPEELKVGVVPESQNFGFYHQLKQRLVGAVDMVRAPIEALREKVERHEEPAPLAEPPLPGQPAPPPEPIEEEPEPVPEPRWEVTLLKKNQLNRHFFMDSVAGFQNQLTALRARMKGQWGEFSSYVSDLLDKTPEIKSIRRRTPKHEWVMPYRMRRVLPDETQEYLLILGAEARAKPRGMGYQAREAYNFSPYFVFATDAEEEGFGESIGERIVTGNALKEYSFQQGAVTRKVMELLEVLKTK